MSYINDALLKAQKDKKSPYAAYEPILSASGKKIKKSRKWLFLAVTLLCLFWAAGAVVLLNGSEKIFGRTQGKKMPAAPAPIIAQKQEIVPASPRIAEKNATSDKKETVFKARPEPVEVKTGSGNAESKRLYEQALKKQQEGDLEGAKALYKKVIKNDPRNIQALNNLGVIYMNKKVYKWAIVRLNDAINVKYNYPDAHYNLACIYAQMNNANQSLFYLKKAVGFNPQVKKWAENDSDLKVLADLPEFKKLLEKNNPK